MRFGFRQFSLDPQLVDSIERVLHSLQLSLHHPHKLAEQVLRLSDFYQTKKRVTPWGESWAQAAYLSYFLPLNWIRLQAVFSHARELGFFSGLKEVWDFGAGPGTAQLLRAPEKWRWTNFELSPEARSLGQKLGGLAHPWFEQVETAPGPRTLGLFSYVLNELPALPEWADDCEALMLIEPSTQQHGRNLQALRRVLANKGFYFWAPCTHQQDCPLLVHSAKDWCHDRVEFARPPWFEALEAKLPMRNSTLTYSYLLARKAPAPRSGLARLVGDQLREKGKTRQLVCQSSERQFLSWMHRSGTPPEISRGSLVRLPEDLEPKNSELRVHSPVEVVADLQKP